MSQNEPMKARSDPLATPASLLQRISGPDGSPADWDRFVRLFTPLLHYWARRLTLQESDAADLVQDVFLVLARKLPRFQYDRTKSFRSWLRSVTVNKWRESCRRPRPNTVGDSRIWDNIPARSGDSDWDEDERRHLIAAALALAKTKFPPLVWTAFQKCTTGGMQPGDVAAELGISRWTVYAYKSRVTRFLREELKEFWHQI
jgi:RNA polymerase sigma-70 factor (ECF subfamily)